MNYYLLCSFCKKGKNFKIFYDAFDENDRFILSESTNKIYSFFCCDRTNFINFDIAFNKETMADLKFQLEYSAFFRLLENFNLKQIITIIKVFQYILVYFSIYKTSGFYKIMSIFFRFLIVSDFCFIPNSGLFSLYCYGNLKNLLCYNSLHLINLYLTSSVDLLFSMVKKPSSVFAFS